MRSEVIRDVESLTGLIAEWGDVWRSSTGRPLTLHPAWIDAWWRTLGGEGELVVVACRDGELRGVAPFYVRPPRGGALRMRELRLVGDNVIGGRAALVARPGEESAVADAVVEALAAEKGWDLLDMTLVSEEGAEQLARRFADRGRKVERLEVSGRPRLALPQPSPPPAPSTTTIDVSCLGAQNVVELPRALAALTELGRVQAGDGRSSDPAFVCFLERALPHLLAEQLAQLWLVEDQGRVVAADLVLTDGDRRVELVRGVAANVSRDGGDALTRAAVNRALDEGARSFELADDDSRLVTAPVEGVRLRVFGAGVGGVLTAGYASLERRAGAVAGAARDAASASLDRLRDASKDMVQRAVARVATLSKMHLYRGELFVRNTAPPTGVRPRLYTLAEFDALPATERAEFTRRLDLVEPYCRQKWERGDLVVLADLDGEPAGVLWCARFPVHVPDIGREVRPLGGECYIHDVFVTPAARGRAVAPAMLEFLARELRARDVYRAWALIERSNTSSTRAFEKASYAAIADVIYARMGLASKLLVRPPDPEARAFLGLR